jgi:valyl-tRNA synthetase
MPTTAGEHWLSDRLNIAANQMASALNVYDFHIALDTLTHFVWDDYADWFIESAKTEVNPHFLYLSLVSTLIMAHPFRAFCYGNHLANTAVYRRVGCPRGLA